MTVDEAAKIHRKKEFPNGEYPIGIKDIEEQCESDFIAGAEWQESKSPWISVKEQLPNDYKEKLILLKDRQVRVAILDEADNEYNTYCFWYDREADETFELEDVIAWMPIPSFDEILEANRDVLQRMKEKGD